ncbi:uncharacterized protein LOC122620253 [Drosophila teissieri]|uniref:uncharacterized protein LOC122620253 n=1 Tax=Drosophila teissieri TaxID=7243 RepID=UPI001CBA4C90|nr:uncharacterized protein LOC122620253 [Drosophila teissieri]
MGRTNAPHNERNGSEHRSILDSRPSQNGFSIAGGSCLGIWLWTAVFCVYFLAVAGSRQPTNHNNSDHNNTNRATVDSAPATTTKAFRHGLCLGLRPTNPPFAHFRRLLLLLL